MKKSTINAAKKLAELIQDKEVLNYFFETYTEETNILAEELNSFDEGKTILETLSVNQIVAEFDARAELGYIAESAINAMEGANKQAFVSKMAKGVNVYSFDNFASKHNKKALIGLLGLREYATKEDIINAINEIL